MIKFTDKIPMQTKTEEEFDMSIEFTIFFAQKNTVCPRHGVSDNKLLIIR